MCVDHFKNVGKWALEESGKYRVNKNDEEIFIRCVPGIIPGSRKPPCPPAIRIFRHCERSEAIQTATEWIDGLLRRLRSSQ
ncbi:MAG TPA: hypothetical protein VFH41_03645 [Bradyrhizobium sp.]|nr:hypothetical protein [Bradyrhizobium sp.]